MPQQCKPLGGDFILRRFRQARAGGNVPALDNGCLTVIPHAFGDGPDGSAAQHPLPHAQHIVAVGGHLADAPCAGSLIEGGQGEILVVDPQDLGGQPCRHSEAKPLLGFAAGTDPSRQSRDPVYQFQVHLAPETPGIGQFTGHTGNPAGAQILEPDSDSLGADKFQHGLVGHGQDPLEEGIRGLDTALVLGGRGGIQGRRGEGRSAHARPVRGLAHQDQVVGLIVCCGRHAAVGDVVCFHQTHGHHIDQTVFVEAGMEV